MGEKTIYKTTIECYHYSLITDWPPPGIQTLNVVLMNILMSQITISGVSILRDKEAFNKLLPLSFWNINIQVILNCLMGKATKVNLSPTCQIVN